MRKPEGQSATSERRAGARQMVITDLQERMFVSKRKLGSVDLQGFHFTLLPPALYGNNAALSHAACVISDDNPKK